MESLSSSETSVLTRATLRNIPEDAIFCITKSVMKANLWQVLLTRTSLSENLGTLVGAEVV
jgi:hypothetical protein